MNSPQHVASQLSQFEPGSLIGVSDALIISQEDIIAFAHLTGDHQWLHVDARRAAAGPFGQTIAHGYLVLSLLPRMTRSVVDFTSLGTVINYGLNKVRFLNGARSDHAFLARISLVSREDKPAGVLYQLQHEISDQATGDTVCVALSLTLVNR